MAIFRVSSFLLDRREKAGYSITPAPWARAGWTSHNCFGCMVVSLDLSNAFDKVNRVKLVSALEHLGIPQELTGAIRSWYLHPDYILKIGDHLRTVHTSRGVRQGCTLAPLLWVVYLYSIIQDLCRAHPSVPWLDLLTAYADDLVLCFPIDDVPDVSQACSSIATFLEFLQKFGLEVNVDKTQVLLHLVGHGSRKLLRKVVRMQDGVRRLKVNEHLLLPLKDEIEYLGVKLSWKRCLDSIIMHRVRRGKRAFAMLHQWWRMPLSLALKIRLFTVMVIPVFTYGVCAGGLSDKGSHLLRKEVMRCLRCLAKSPVHITLESDARLLGRLGLVHPLSRIQVSCCQLMRRMLETLDLEVCPCSHLKQLVNSHSGRQSFWWTFLLAGIQMLLPEAPILRNFDDVRRLLLSVPKAKLRLAQIQSSSVRASANISEDLTRSYVCEGCGRSFYNYNRLRSHQYGSKCAWSRTTGKFTPSLDCRVEDPICHWCHKSFLWWSGLKMHIEQGQCSQMDRRREEIEAVSTRQSSAPALHLDKDLSTHCVLCGRWAPLSRSLSKHIKSAHAVEFQNGMLAYALANLSALKIRHQCPFCMVTMRSTWNMRTHVRSHCLVLLQRFIAGLPCPTDPSHPGTPASEQACTTSLGHGAVISSSSSIRSEVISTIALPSSRRAVERCVGRIMPEASQTRQIRRRLRGKQADPRCQHEDVSRILPAASQASKQTYSRLKPWCSTDSESRTAGEDVGSTCTPATRGSSVSQSCMRICATHGQRRAEEHGCQPSQDEQSMEISHGEWRSSQRSPSGADVQDNNGISGLTDQRIEPSEGWRLSLRLLSDKLLDVLRTDLGHAEGTSNSCSRWSHHVSAGCDEDPRRAIPEHECRIDRESEGLTATPNSLSHHHSACPHHLEPSQSCGHESMGATTSARGPLLLGTDRQHFEARPRQAEQSRSADHEQVYPQRT